MISFSFYSKEYKDLPLDNLLNVLPSLVHEEGGEVAALSIIFCSDEDMLELNQQHLKHDYYTDIITFDYSNKDFISGDLFVSIDRVLDNAVSWKTTFEEEFHRVVFHGVLHLMGYQDKEDHEIALMRQKENYYLTKLFHVKHGR